MKKTKKLYNNIDEIIIDVDKGKTIHYFNNNHFVYKKHILLSSGCDYHICTGNRILCPITEGDIKKFYSLI
ncbi:hypothetical protein DAC22_98 [Bacteroides phage DAC22]|nr:hypothetical protein DAC22_98 [Bacteroides phage DAC22]